MNPTRTSGARLLGIGVLILAGSLLLIFSPLLLGPGTLNRFIVAAGLLGACLSLSLMLHGVWDWWRQRER
jgi:hypothetical protein